MTDSFGKVVANPRYYRTIKGKIAKAQKVLSRRQRRAKKETIQDHEREAMGIRKKRKVQTKKSKKQGGKR